MPDLEASWPAVSASVRGQPAVVLLWLNWARPIHDVAALDVLGNGLLISHPTSQAVVLAPGNEQHLLYIFKVEPSEQARNHIQGWGTLPIHFGPWKRMRGQWLYTWNPYQNITN